MRRQGGGRVPTPYNEDFFYWWQQQIITLDDYPYVGINFKGDPYMPLPPGTTYGDIGMSNVFKYVIFSYFCIIEQKYFWMVLKY
jgi:hypothetical protein